MNHSKESREDSCTDSQHRDQETPEQKEQRLKKAMQVE